MHLRCNLGLRTFRHAILKYHVPPSFEGRQKYNNLVFYRKRVVIGNEVLKYAICHLQFAIQINA